MQPSLCHYDFQHLPKVIFFSWFQKYELSFQTLNMKKEKVGKASRTALRRANLPAIDKVFTFHRDKPRIKGLNNRRPITNTIHIYPYRLTQISE